MAVLLERDELLRRVRRARGHEHDEVDARYGHEVVQALLQLRRPREQSRRLEDRGVEGSFGELEPRRFVDGEFYLLDHPIVHGDDLAVVGALGVDGLAEERRRAALELRAGDREAFRRDEKARRARLDHESFGILWPLSMPVREATYI